MRDELKTLLLAGHETTAIALAWAFYWLHRQPGVCQYLQGGLKAFGPIPYSDGLAHLPYFDRGVCEPLRLCPVMAVITRRLRQRSTYAVMICQLASQSGLPSRLPISIPRSIPTQGAFGPNISLGARIRPSSICHSGAGRAAVEELPLRSTK